MPRVFSGAFITSLVISLLLIVSIPHPRQGSLDEGAFKLFVIEKTHLRGGYGYGYTLEFSGGNVSYEGKFSQSYLTITVRCVLDTEMEGVCYFTYFEHHIVVPRTEIARGVRYDFETKTLLAEGDRYLWGEF